MKGQPRVFLIGYGPTTETALRSLMVCVNVVGVLRETTDPSDPVVLAAQRGSIPVFTALPGELGYLLAETQTEYVVISSYNRIIGSDLLKSYPFINVHYAPLPAYRGRAPVNWAIINGEPETAITIHLVDTGLDSGNILYQEKIPISNKDNVTDLYQRLNIIQEQQLGQAVLKATAGYRGSLQKHTSATYGCARLPDDGEIEWGDSAVKIDRLIRALTPPFPGAFTYFSGQRVTIWRAEPVRDLEIYVGRVPGRIIRVSREERWIDVLAGEGALRIYEVEVEGEGLRMAADLFRSTRATLGLRTTDLHGLLTELSARISRLEKELYQQFPYSSSDPMSP